LLSLEASVADKADYCAPVPLGFFNGLTRAVQQS